MPASPDPTDEQLREARFVGTPNMAASLDELARRLKTNLPREIALMNSDYGWTGNDSIEAVPVKNIQRAPAIIGAAANGLTVNSVLVGHGIEAQALAPGIFKDQVTVTIYDLHRKVEEEQQWKTIEKRACAIRSVLYHFLVDCYDEDERLCWKQLFFMDSGKLPEPFNKFAGVALRYKMTITPEAGQWAIG